MQLRFWKVLTIAFFVILLTASECGTINSPPQAVIADAGNNQTVTVGETVILDGSGSSGNIVSYAWELEQRPSGSTTTLENADAVQASFIADRAGDYRVSLTVSDRERSSTDVITITATASSGEPQGTLEPGGLFVGEDGVTLGATPGALEEAIGVSVERVDDPTSLPSLGDTRAEGAMYRLSSPERFITPPDAPLLVGLPVPAGEDPAGLALAVLSPAIGHSGGSETVSAATAWSGTDATFDPDSGLLVAPLYSFSTTDSGLVLTLIEDDAAESVIANMHLNDSALAPQAGVVGRFAAKCSVKFNHGECTREEEEEAARVANDFFHAMVIQRGFHSPKIRPLVADIKATLKPPSFSFTVQVAAHLIDLIPDGAFGCKGEWEGRGRYVLPLLKAYICLPRDQINSITDPNGDRQEVINHEVFHGIQYGYGHFIEPDQFAQQLYWPIVEGTANAAIHSRSTMQVYRNIRGWSNRHPVDVPLVKEFRLSTDTLDYASQSFWVFVGQRNSVGIDYLRTVFGTGLTASRVDFAFKGLFGEGYGLSEAYWDWAKNQAFEAHITEGNLGVNEPCVLNTDVIDEDAAENPIIPWVHFNPHDGIRGYNNLVTELEPLSSRIYEIVLEAYQSSYFADIRVNIDNPNIKVKFYEKYDSATTACHSTPDGKTYTTGVDVNAGIKIVYMLISNVGFQHTPVLFTSPNDELFFEVIRPGVEIVNPDDAAIVPEGEVVFRAEVENPLDSSVSFAWSINGEAKGDSFASTLITTLCPGDHNVEVAARFRGVAGTVTATDFITITAQNNEPEVEIAEAPANIGEDNDFRLVGRVTDPTCEDPRGTLADLDRLIWDVEDGFGGTGASIITSFTSQGNKEVTLTYTDAAGAKDSDSFTIDVGPFNPDSDPVVAIRAPQNGAFFPFSGRYEIAVEGHVSSSVGDADVVWSYHTSASADCESGSSGWNESARGRSATLQLDPKERDTTYALRLHIDGEPMNRNTCQVITITTEGNPQ